MYISDYGFAASPGNWTTRLSFYYNDTNRSNNWMYLGVNEWTIYPRGDYDNKAYYVSSSGRIDNSNLNNLFVVRPTFYLNPNVTYAGGTGTESDPYRIA